MKIIHAERATSHLSARSASLAWQGCGGLLFGYLVLHPASMVVFQWLDPRIAAAATNDMSSSWWAPIAHSFHAEMLAMGLVFGAIGASLALFSGYYRLRLAAQRDRLAEQAEMLQRSNEELARLELANRRTSQFMAHDFKTSLGCIAGFANELLQRPQLQEDREVAHGLACIRRQANVMLGNVADLLEFSRVREGHRPQKQRSFAAELLQEAVADFSLPAHTQRITLGDHCRSCPPVLADARLLRRVLCNLISNAIKHNGPDAQVHVDAQVDQSRREVVFSCCDNGAGIPAERLPSIFTEFVGRDDGSSDSTGLGLAFCKTVVEAHGGRIWCENLRRGARFLFTVPLSEDRQSAK